MRSVVKLYRLGGRYGIYIQKAKTILSSKCPLPPVPLFTFTVVELIPPPTKYSFVHLISLYSFEKHQTEQKFVWRQCVVFVRCFVNIEFPPETQESRPSVCLAFNDKYQLWSLSISRGLISQSSLVWLTCSAMLGWVCGRNSS